MERTELIAELEQVNEHAKNVVCLLCAMEIVMLKNEDERGLGRALSGIREYADIGVAKPIDQLVGMVMDADS